MTRYNVHIYREMKLRFDGIEADSSEAAANIARDRLTEDADDIEPCDGDTSAALVDAVGDEDFTRSVWIDFVQPAEIALKPIILITVRGGLVRDVHSTNPATVIVEDWDCPELPFVIDFESEILTPEQQSKLEQRLVELNQTNGEFQ
jgi:hypothetical protein